MKTGVIGSSLSGKTTLFNALSGSEIPVGTGTREIHIANVKVPDERINQLTRVYEPKRTIYAEIDFVDFGGGFDSKTDAQTVAKMREMDCLALVLGAYQTDDEKDMETELKNLLSEMIIIDLMVCEKRIERLIKESKKDLEYSTLVRCKEALENENFISKLELSDEELKAVSQFRFFTLIPIIVILNVSESHFNQVKYSTVENICTNYGMFYLYLSGSIEMEIASLPPEDQKDFLADLGVTENAKNRFIREAYDKMKLISFFTAGKDEVKAWTIKNGTVAQKAAGKIHSDIERGFIRAEVMSYDDLAANSFDESKVKSAGKLRLEGKNYTVKYGDIIVYRFNV